MKEIINKYKYEIILAIFTFSYFIYFTAASFLRYVNYYTGRFDLGNMAQTAWNTIHGNFFMLTNPNGTEEISRLAFHADFILIPLSLSYLIWEDPRSLLLIQTLVLSFGGVFVYFIANQILKNKMLSLTFAVCFFLNPGVQYTNLYDFHSVTLATTFLLGAFYFILKKRWGWVVLFLFLAGITKEQVWSITALFGIYIIFVSRQKTLGLVITGLSILTFIILFWYAIPTSLGSEHFAVEFYSDYGSSPADIMKNVFLHPVQTIQTLLLEDRLDYIKKLFMPLGYLSFIAFPFLIFAGPDLLINLLSSSSPMHQIYYQYSATITPFIFIAAIYGVYFILKKLPEIPYQAICLIILILTFASAYNYGPLIFAKKPNDAMFQKPLANRKFIDDYLKTLTDENIISASNNLGSHLSHRNQIYVVPLGYVGKTQANTVLFLLENPDKSEIDKFHNIKNNPDFHLELRNNNFYVFKRISP